jgi:hypothetical protein
VKVDFAIPVNPPAISAIKSTYKESAIDEAVEPRGRDTAVAKRDPPSLSGRKRRYGVYAALTSTRFARAPGAIGTVMLSIPF